MARADDPRSKRQSHGSKVQTLHGTRNVVKDCLTALPDGLFNGFRKLRTLQLQSNQLVRLPPKLFQNLSSLELLNLSRNALEELPPSLFGGLNLSVIDLSHNKLSTLNATQFDLENLTTLDLRGNRLTDATREDLARLKGTFTCDSSTAELAVEYLRQVLDEPWHGNVLLSCGPHKLEPKQRLQEFNADFVFANYSWLSSGPPINIAATELRGITIEQLSSLLVFVEDVASSWCEAHHLGYGQPLSFEAFNLYHANFWVIGPATAGHGRGGCSYVELVATSAQMQRPLWFVSHAWLEPVCKFVACLKCHASLHQLPDQTAYWVCAYANNQHQLENEICNNPRKTSFYRAIQLCAGVLLVLDENATPFTRIWCCFEESIAVEERNKGNPLLLDVAATENGRAHVITDGLAGAEQEMMPLLGFLAKSRREAEFPTEILMKGLDVNIASAMASEPSDRTKILNSIRLPRAGTVFLEQEARDAHESYDAVGRALAGHFALANWLLTALQNDEKRRVVQLSLTGCCNLTTKECCRHPTMSTRKRIAGQKMRSRV
ncbi:unnamed protein product [Cladocopium goreaui]|uniref:Phospholipase A2 inhibitor (Beta-PLI) n=1 Tax=Cladocopium goreaui TaxID=2562237 RepID=A0A9P1C6Y0_9DINO|nr:unnamed protein product [Cladocopium goreaui]